MYIVLAFILVPAAILHALVGLALKVVMPRDSNNQKLFNNFLQENTYEDIVKTTVPDVTAWYRSMDGDKTLLPANRRMSVSPSGAACVDRFFQQIEVVVNETSPAHVELALKSLGLSDSLLTQVALQNLLDKPQPLAPWIEETTSCIAKNSVLGHLCDAFESSIGPKPNFDEPYQTHILIYFANVFAVYQTLTSKAMTDVSLLSEISNTMIDLIESREQGYDSTYKDPSIQEFAKFKYQGVTQSLQVLKHAIGENKVSQMTAHRLQINILEAVKVDASLGYRDNARVGLALASAVSVGPVVTDHVVHWKLGREWVEAYLSWNMAFISGSLPLNLIIKLMIPAVSCTAMETPDGNGFIAPRTLSLALALMHEFPSMTELKDLVDKHNSSADGGLDVTTIESLHTFYHSSQSLSKDHFDMAHVMGKSNLQHSILPSPSKDTVERMLHSLCGTSCYDGSYTMSWTSIESHLNDEDFKTYIGVILYMTAMLTGLGLEFFGWDILTMDMGWSTKQETWWWLAQFLFPLFAATSLGLSLSRNFMTLPFLAIGLWKFGMPETVSYMYGALYQDVKDPDQARFKLSWGQLSKFINSVGNIMHHSASILTIVMFLSGAVLADRHMVASIVVLIMQHWFTLLKYKHLYLFCVIEIVLEVYFEWVIFSELHYVHSRHPSLSYSSSAMLVAHWMYFFAGMLELAVDSTTEQVESLSGTSGKDDLLRDCRASGGDDILGMNIGHYTDDEETNSHEIDTDFCDDLLPEGKKMARIPKRRSSLLTIFFSKELDV
ncbi:expressed unknown protein [Seminavis robusta]|uniref:Uncharacterized protein n=1 Tax=Seminavis robusta TaxID=568900 RepID=A0A9N8EQT4_9STRA|nr:expressed unknown protein [Seminavis robusta]|eukprot:Sro1577_g283550.1 n/a (779) ;mRNA; f:1848-4184